MLKEVNDEVRRVNRGGEKENKEDNEKKGFVVMTGIAKKMVDKKKGELIEQNQDGLEVSSFTIILSAY